MLKCGKLSEFTTFQHRNNNNNKYLCTHLKTVNAIQAWTA